MNPEGARKQNEVYLTGQFLLMPADISKIANSEKIFFEILYLSNKSITITIEGGTLDEWKEVINKK